MDGSIWVHVQIKAGDGHTSLMYNSNKRQTSQTDCDTDFIVQTKANTYLSTTNCIDCDLFFLPTETHKRRKSLRRKFDSFSKEKKERGEFMKPQTIEVGKHDPVCGYKLWMCFPTGCYAKCYHQTQCPFCPLKLHNHIHHWSPVAFTTTNH